MKYSPLTILKRAWKQAKEFRLHITTLFLLGLLSTPIALLKPYALKVLLDSGFGNQPLPEFIRIFFPEGYSFGFNTIVLIAAGLVIITALIENLVTFCDWTLGTYTGEKLVLSFRSVLFNHIQRLSLAYHDQKGSSDSLYRIQWDTMSLRTLLISNISPLIHSSLTLIAMIVVMFFINPVFALITMGLIPILFIMIRISASKLRKNWYVVKDDESKAASVLHEVLGALRVVKAFGQEKNESDRFMNRADKAVKGQTKLARMAALFYLLVGLLFAIATAAFIYLGAHYVQSGKITVGELTLVIAYLVQIFGPLQNISKIINDIQASIASLERVYTVIDQESEVKDIPGAKQIDKAKGAFECRDLGFAYENNQPVLKNISFTVSPGDRVGIKGTTGAGKSTLINLLTRFYDCQQGMILLDGMDIKTIKLEDYRTQFSIVLQDPVLFSTTIGENIAYGKPGATEEEIFNAAKLANAHEFIMQGAEGYDTMVGERGLQLSGGERQRISLARAFIKNAPILILDEPTSSLDTKTEQLIIDAMQRLMEGRTTFMITHRIDTLRFCNKVLHIEKGELIEDLTTASTAP